jgi:hypothetical protein
VSIFAFFRWLRARNIKFYKIVKLLPDPIVESLPLPSGKSSGFAEKILFKRAQKPNIEPEAFKFLQEIYHDDVLKLESLLGRSLPWPTISSSNTIHRK